ncbi:hypothetical protein JST97_32985 [bacterium]|nr:hypothetical protein [bacterium]
MEEAEARHESWKMRMRNRSLANLFALSLLLVGCAGFAWFQHYGLSAHRSRIPPSRSSAPVNRSIYDMVVVKVLEKPLQAEPSKLEGLLFDEFANQPESKKLESYTTTRWRANFQVFSRILVTKAADQNLDFASLEDALGLALEDANGLAYLPVGAYQTTLNGRLVWVVRVKWEAASWSGVALSHVRMYVFDQQTLKQVGFATCG